MTEDFFICRPTSVVVKGAERGWRVEVKWKCGVYAFFNDESDPLGIGAGLVCRAMEETARHIEECHFSRRS